MSFKNGNTPTFDHNDEAALNRRAERFHREHELERQKSMGTIPGVTNGGQASLRANYQNAHLFNDRLPSRPASPSTLGAADNPEADPVCLPRT